MIWILLVVLICLLLGFALIDWTTCKRIVYQFPTIQNFARIVYQDDVGKCYQYYPVTMQCPAKI